MIAIGHLVFECLSAGTGRPGSEGIRATLAAVCTSAEKSRIEEVSFGSHG